MTTISVKFHDGTTRIEAGGSWKGGGPSWLEVAGGDCSPVCATITYHNATNVAGTSAMDTTLTWQRGDDMQSLLVWTDPTKDIPGPVPDWWNIAETSPLPLGYSWSWIGREAVQEGGYASTVLVYTDVPAPVPLPASGLLLAACVAWLLSNRKKG